MNQTAVELYIDEMPFKEAFSKLDDVLQTKVIIEANKQLIRFYGASIITDEMVAIQSVYMAEGEAEGHAKFRRQSVTHMRVEDIAFTYDSKAIGIAPDVLALIESTQGDPEAVPAIFGKWL